MSVAQRFAQVFGAIYLLVGILGFIAISPILIGTAPGVLNILSGYLLGIFAVNLLHDLAHLAIGIAGLAVYRNPIAARSYALVLGVAYALLFVLGLLPPPLSTVFTLIPLFGAPDIILHLLTAIIAFGAFFLSREAAGAPNPRV